MDPEKVMGWGVVAAGMPANPPPPPRPANSTLWGGFAVWEPTTAANVPTLVKAAGVRAGQRVLDVGTGTGVAAITAARAGARAVGVDPTPELLERARENARLAQVGVEFRQAGAEELPFPDAEFDVVVSHFGHMFAPRAQRAADELLRVLKPGGALAFTTWPPDAGFGAIFNAIAGQLPPPPPGTDNPEEWGDPEVVRRRLGDRVRDLAFEHHEMRVAALSPGHVRAMMEQVGPGKLAAETLQGEALARFRADVEKNLEQDFRDNIVRRRYLLTRATKS